MGSEYSNITEGPSLRIKSFLEESRERGCSQPSSNFVADLRAAFAEYRELPWRIRQARAWSDALSQLPVYLFSDDQLVGMVYHLADGSGPNPMERWMVEGEKQARRLLPEDEELVVIGAHSGGTSPGHITWNWDLVLEKGIRGLLSEYREALRAAGDQQARDFYRGVLLMFKALLEWNERHIIALEKKLGQERDPREGSRLNELLALIQRVPAEPARSFHEAVQAFYFQYIAVMRENPYGGNGPGRLDYFLWPYLEIDLKEGKITLQGARELIDELFIRIHERIQDADGWVEAIVVGGSDREGYSAVNPLSRIMVESIMALEQTHPSIYIRVSADPPTEFLDLATHYLIHGGNRAQILNDSALIPAIQNSGVKKEDARMYTCGGCMEIVPQGMNSDFLFTGTHNIPKVVELVLFGGECLKTGRKLEHAAHLASIDSYSNFDQLYQAFSRELERQMTLYFQRIDIYSEMAAKYRPVYLMSSMLADCRERGREQQDGGVRYHHYGSSPLGIPNAGDILNAVKKAVFEFGFCSGEELLSALRANFQGYEELRLRLLNLPRYGQDDPDADAMTEKVLNTVCDIYAGYRNRFGGRVKPVVLTFRWAPTAGGILGAAADGSLAGKPIAHGLTPQNSSMTGGITAAINSHTGLSLDRVAGGAASMWDLDKKIATRQVVGPILKTFLDRGGHIFQGNMTDVSELIEARKDPGEFPQLMVRVGGYSARFVTLDQKLQDEIIKRYRHSS